jgi:fatty acid desaturase
MVDIIQRVLTSNLSFIMFGFCCNLHYSSLSFGVAYGLMHYLLFIFIYRRISHRTHHQNHGHVENDESWHPVSKFPVSTVSPFVIFFFFLEISSSVFKAKVSVLFLQLSERIYKNLDNLTKAFRFSAPFPLFAYPFYLVSGWHLG